MQKIFVTNPEDFLNKIKNKENANLNNEVMFSNFSDNNRGEYYRISYLVNGVTNEYFNSNKIVDIIRDFNENYK